MKLRHKTLVVIGTTVTGLIIILYLMSDLFIMHSFSRLEDQLVQQNVKRCLNTLNDDIGTLGDLTVNLAAWDDTYRFIENLNQEYINSNLLNDAFLELKINTMVFFNLKREIIYVKAIDLEKNEGIPPPAGLYDHLAWNSPLFSHPDNKSGAEGVLILPEGPILIASRPIVTSDYEGPARGTLVLGRKLDSTVIDSLSERNQLSVALHRVEGQDPQAAHSYNGIRLGENEVAVQPIDRNITAGYTLIKDIYGNPGLVLEAAMPRDVYLQGRTSAMYYVLFLLAASVLFCGIVMFLMEKMVLSRLARLSTAISSLGSGGGLSARVYVAGHDELANLANEMNRMLDEVEQSQRNIKENEERFRLLAENARDTIYRYRIAPPRGFDYVSPSVTGLTGYTPVEFYDNPDQFTELIYTDDASLFKSIILNSQNFDKPFILRCICKDGKNIWTEHHIVPVYDEASGLLVAIEGITWDITERKLAEEHLMHNSLHDSLTGLHNRTYFEQEMHRLYESHVVSAGIIMCDVDGLKFINDTLGHNAGDTLLAMFAGLIKSSIRKTDIVARLGGDEFAILLPDSDINAVENTHNRIQNAIDRYNAASPTLPMRISIGYAARPSSSAGMNELLKEADDNMYREKILRSPDTSSLIIKGFMMALKARDNTATGHTDRLQDMATGFAEYLSLSETRIAGLRLLVQYHDIGMVGISDSIVFKTGSLTQGEVNEMRRHCEIGYRIAMSSPNLIPIADWILKHHERWDGAGYPLGLKGEDIPLECRILAIADAYDAMTGTRSYRKAMSRDEALAELMRCSRTQFDPLMISIFIKLYG